jgi:putative serine protease PepD
MPTSHLNHPAPSNGPAAGSASAREGPRLRSRPLRQLVALALASAVIGAGIVTGLLYATGAGNQGQVTTVQQLGAGSKGPGASTSIDAGGIYSAAAPGVVDITASGIPSSSSGLPLIPQKQSETATGTGFEIDSHGDILTAEHVVADAAKIAVTFDNGVTRSATLLGADRSTDVAVLKVDPSGLTQHPLALGSFGALAVGDPLAVIGDPFDFDRSPQHGRRLSRQPHDSGTERLHDRGRDPN